MNSMNSNDETALMVDVFCFLCFADWDQTSAREHVMVETWLETPRCPRPQSPPRARRRS